MKFATRLNSFNGTGDAAAALRRVAAIEGIDYVDLNYPEHFTTVGVEAMKPLLDGLGLTLNSVAMRFRRDFAAGEYSNVDEKIRQEAIDLTKAGIDAAVAGGSDLVTVWLGFDGFDYTFQKDYVADEARIVEAFQELADYNPAVRLSIEYKPYEERVHSMIGSLGATINILKLIDRDNVGATLDFAHMLMAGDHPALGAAQLLAQGKLWGVHLNDGNNAHDDGLMIGSIHPFETLEFIYYLLKYGYDAPIYFDTFPIREEAEAEARANLATIQLLIEKVQAVGVDHITEVIQKADGVAAQKLRNELLGISVLNPVA
ncbi:sugar phosphate isomerase/epimerase [Frondihabitans sp. VKM Ac-2883]|uniref:sugar phosphate isomerase/epimerase family protein n=1 Tax=Frondihabitans sp. VKM Ac-2883 TaxID=2783823 RepID=UPI00188A923C|nr:sugar phosphate isomerase/epimerase family protein [Frondihabitans sp. VKM Ac-2883]MBF4577536.1 TIM barrel protein [Frondihabitans sp. VKM Ac-2883]